MRQGYLVRNAAPAEAFVDPHRPSNETVRAKRAEIARRYGKKKGQPSIGSLRVGELRRLFIARYGMQLPDDQTGRELAKIMACHVACNVLARAKEPSVAVTLSIRQWAPWMADHELADVVEEVLSKPRRFRADPLAQRLNLTEAERARLQIRTIGACDMSKNERKARRQKQKRQRDRERRERDRRANGAQPRAASLSQSQPWVSFGMSRAHWYRVGKPMPDETDGSPNIFSLRAGDEPISHDINSARRTSEERMALRLSKKNTFTELPQPRGAMGDLPSAVRHVLRPFKRDFGESLSTRTKNRTFARAANKEIKQLDRVELREQARAARGPDPAQHPILWRRFTSRYKGKKGLVFRIWPKLKFDLSDTDILLDAGWASSWRWFFGCEQEKIGIFKRRRREHFERLRKSASWTPQSKRRV